MGKERKMGKGRMHRHVRIDIIGCVGKDAQGRAGQGRAVQGRAVQCRAVQCSAVQCVCKGYGHKGT